MESSLLYLIFFKAPTNLSWHQFPDSSIHDEIFYLDAIFYLTILRNNRSLVDIFCIDYIFHLHDNYVCSKTPLKLEMSSRLDMSFKLKMSPM